MLLRRALLSPKWSRPFSSFSDGVQGKGTVLVPPSSILTRVIGVEDATPSTKLFTLQTLDDQREVSFRPGQWCDVLLPVCHNRGATGAIPLGLSICNAPSSYSPVMGYSTCSTLQFACKISHHPLVRYLHERARPHHTLGTLLYVSDGQGEFAFDPSVKEDIVLIGGGIGITPLISITRAIHLYHENTTCTIIHCVRDASELLFQSELGNIARESDHVDYVPLLSSSKLSHETLRAFVRPQRKYYLCGPHGYVRHVYSLLRGMGVHEHQCMYEKWVDCTNVLPNVEDGR